MEVALGLDQRVGLSVAQLRDLAPDAARAGYASLWTPAGGPYDSLQLCAAWCAVSRLSTGISVVPITWVPPRAVGIAARTVHELSGGRLILGLGAGSVKEKAIAAVRDYVKEVRVHAPDVPLYLAALGPQMLALAGKLADGVLPNWSSPDVRPWLRERIGKDLPLVEYVRVCVDDDVAAARSALAKQVLAYALQRRGAAPHGGYRGHFARMGFEGALRDLDARRDRGATEDELVAAAPDEMLNAVGYFGPAAGAREAFARLSRGLDVAIVRVLSAHPGKREPVVAAIEAFAPQNARA